MRCLTSDPVRVHRGARSGGARRRSRRRCPRRCVPPPTRFRRSSSPGTWRISPPIELAGRNTPSPGFDAAADYIIARLARAGLRPGGDSGTFKQSYELHETRVETNTRVDRDRRPAVRVRPRLRDALAGDAARRRTAGGVRRSRLGDARITRSIPTPASTCAASWCWCTARARCRAVCRSSSSAASPSARRRPGGGRRARRRRRAVHHPRRRPDSLG